jgi:pimeloyl-ACP methyl ester carboxylesterase
MISKRRRAQLLQKSLKLANNDSLTEGFVVPKVKVNDIQMYYEVKGEGFPLVMINGGNENLDCWDPRLIEALSKRFELVLFDNRDAGRTSASDREYALRLLADDAAGLMNVLGISRAYVLGFSMGGMIAQEVAINYPEKVLKLVLCSTGGTWGISPELSEFVLELERTQSTEEVVRLYRSLPIASDYPSDFIEKYPSVINGFTADFVKKHPDFVEFYFRRLTEHPVSKEGARRQWNAWKQFNTQGRLPQIKAPTLVLHGKKDFVLPPENGLILANTIPNARLVYFEKSAHVLAEEMEQVIKVITEFLLQPSSLF